MDTVEVANVCVEGIGNAWNSVFNESAEDDPVVYPDTPATAPEKFRPDGTKGKKNTEDGSYWEKDTSGHGGGK